MDLHPPFVGNSDLLRRGAVQAELVSFAKLPVAIVLQSVSSSVVGTSESHKKKKEQCAKARHVCSHVKIQLSFDPYCLRPDHQAWPTTGGEKISTQRKSATCLCRRVSGVLCLGRSLSMVYTRSANEVGVDNTKKEPGPWNMSCLQHEAKGRGPRFRKKGCHKRGLKKNG